jgi:SAM-dependent methyltransferase
MNIKWYNTRFDMYLDFPTGAVGLELGVGKGQNACHLLTTTKPKELHLVDTWNTYHIGINFIAPENQYWELDEPTYDEHIEKLFEKEISKKEVLTHKQDVFEFLAGCDDNSFDWAYVDDKHIYNHVKKELYEVIRVVKPGGIIAGHDFCILRRGWGLGPVAAVLEHVQEGSLEIIGLSQEEYPSFMCKVKK